MAIGVGDDDQRHFVGFTCANSESYASWHGFLQERGVRNMRLVTSNALGSLAALHRAHQARRARQDRLRGAPDGAPSTIAPSMG